MAAILQNYQVTQMLTGHGCFGEYLHRIGRAPTLFCAHCGRAIDTATHSRFVRYGMRPGLRAYVDHDLSLSSVLAMLGSEENWHAVLLFCERVMLQKEKAEREHKTAGYQHAPARRCARAAHKVPSPTSLSAFS